LGKRYITLDFFHSLVTQPKTVNRAKFQERQSRLSQILWIKIPLTSQVNDERDSRTKSPRFVGGGLDLES
jgi:hypothetical protein